MDAQVSYCERKEEKTFYWIQSFAIIIICCLVLLVAIGTWMEMRSDPNSVNSEKLGNRIIFSFSAITNFKLLFSTKASLKIFSCVHGLRFLTITWIVYGHSYFFPGLLHSSYRSLFRIPETTTEPAAQIIANGSEAVDTFLFIGGMLVSYLTIRRAQTEKGKFNYLTYALHRYWRIAPGLYFVLLCSFLIPLMGSGPIFQEIMDNSVYPCFTKWWRNVLFINNYFDSYKSCWKMTWYVSVDMQLYLISPIFVLPMIWFKKKALMIIIFIISLTIIYTGLVTYLFDIAPTLVVHYFNPDDEYYFFVYTYGNALSRAGPYFIGIFTGYLLVTKPDIKMSKKFQIVGWCLATLSSGMVIFATSIWYRVRFPTQLEIILYAATYKVAYTAGIAWMTFCCATGYGGFVNTFLSWKVWRPLGRLAFLTYLIQVVVQMAYMSNFKTTQEYTHLQFAVQYFGFLCISMLLAFISNLLVESPFLNLEKMLFETKDKKKAEKPEVKSQTNSGFENGDITNNENGHVEMLTCENNMADMENHKNSPAEKSQI